MSGTETPGRTLVAGVGNIFLQDDGFGVETVRRLGALDPSRLPPGTELMDAGIRGVHLAYRLLEGYRTLVLVDLVSRGSPPGTLYTIDVGPRPRAPGTGPARSTPTRWTPPPCSACCTTCTPALEARSPTRSTSSAANPGTRARASGSARPSRRRWSRRWAWCWTWWRAAPPPYRSGIPYRRRTETTTLEDRMHWMWIGVAAGLAALYGLVRNLPDARRYLRMRRM